MWRTAVNLLLHRLVNAHGQYQLTRLLVFLHLIDEPRIFGIFRVLQHFRLDVVQGQRQFLIFLVLIVVPLAEVGFLLMVYHLFHQLHGRIVLTTVARTFLLDGKLLQHLHVLSHGHEEFLCIVAYLKGASLIAHRTDLQFATFHAANLKASGGICHSSQLRNLILDSCHDNILARRLVDDMAGQ